MSEKKNVLVNKGNGYAEENNNKELFQQALQQEKTIEPKLPEGGPYTVEFTGLEADGEKEIFIVHFKYQNVDYKYYESPHIKLSKDSEKELSYQEKLEWCLNNLAKIARQLGVVGSFKVMDLNQYKGRTFSVWARKSARGTIYHNLSGPSQAQQFKTGNTTKEDF